MTRGLIFLRNAASSSLAHRIIGIAMEDSHSGPQPSTCHSPSLGLDLAFLQHCKDLSVCLSIVLLL